MHLFNIILQDEDTKFNRKFEKLVKFIKGIVRSFMDTLQKNPNLAFLAFQWKTKNQCLLIKHPYLENDEEVPEVKPLAKGSRRSSRNAIRDGATKAQWSVEEDDQLAELYEKYKDSSACFDMIWPLMDNADKQNINEVFFRLRELGLISKNHAIPDNLVIEKESAAEDLDDIFRKEPEAEHMEEEEEEEESEEPLFISPSWK